MKDLTQIEIKIDQIVDIIRSNQSFLLIPHIRADGDAIGSSLALKRVIEKRFPGKKVEFVLLNSLSERYRFIFGNHLPKIVGEDISVEDLPSVDVVFVIDTAVREQVEPVLPFLDKTEGKVVIVDHHSHWDLRSDLKLIDEEIPATGMVIAKIIDKLKVEFDKEIAEYLLLAIGTDTGWFSYNNTTSECYYWANRCLEAGANNRWLYENLFLSDSIERFKLLSRALASAEMFEDGKIVVFTLYRKDFEETGSEEPHTENIVDFGCRLKTMVVSVLFREQEGGNVRISLRSRTGFDVNQFAQKFGGGGHPCAAGIRIPGDIETVKKQVIEELVKDIGRVGL